MTSYRWLVAAGALALLAMGFVFVWLLSLGSWIAWQESVLSLLAVLEGAGAISLVVEYFDAGVRADQAFDDWLFGPKGVGRLVIDWERWPRPPQQRRPKVLDEPRDSAFWMKRLAKCYARLARFEELEAPETIIEQERKMIRDAIALLSPEDAIAVMRSWKDLDSAHMKKRRKTPPAEGSN